MKFRLPPQRKWMAIAGGAVILCLGAAVAVAGLSTLQHYWPFNAFMSAPEEGAADADGAQKSKEDKGHGPAAQAPKENSAKDASKDQDHGTAQQDATPHETPPIAIPPPGRFQQEVRQLLIVQTDSAHGRTPVNGTQRELIERNQSALHSLDAASATQQDMEALAIYLLSGGSPRGLTKLLEDLKPSGDLKKVIQGARSYAAGNLEAAQKSFAGVDVSTLSPLIAARVLLAQSTIAADEPDSVQRSFLQQAANTLPGTLVEEAALRRLVALDVKSRNGPDFTLHAKRYVRRFPKSLYAEEFAASFAEGVVVLETTGHKTDDAFLSSIVRPLLPVQAERALVVIARRAAESGLRDLCLLAGSPAYADLLTDGLIRKRMTLYTTACEVVQDPSQALGRLAQLDAADLSEQDMALRADAMRLASAMLGQASGPAPSEVEGPELPDQATAAVMVSATQQLQVSRELINEANR